MLGTEMDMLRAVLPLLAAERTCFMLCRLFRSDNQGAVAEQLLVLRRFSVRFRLRAERVYTCKCAVPFERPA